MNEDLKSLFSQNSIGISICHNKFLYEMNSVTNHSPFILFSVFNNDGPLTSIDQITDEQIELLQLEMQFVYNNFEALKMKKMKEKETVKIEINKLIEQVNKGE